MREAQREWGVLGQLLASLGVTPACVLAGGRVLMARACEVRRLSERTAYVWREPEKQLARAGRGRKCFAGCWGVGDACACARVVSAGLLRLCCAHAAGFGAASAPAGRAASEARSAAVRRARAASTRTTPRQISHKVSPAKHVSGEQLQLRARRKLRARAIPCCRQAFVLEALGATGFCLECRSDSGEFLACFFSSAGSPKQR